MALSETMTSILLQTYRQPTLAQRQEVLSVLTQLGMPAPVSQVEDEPPFDAPEGTVLPRVYAVQPRQRLEAEQMREVLDHLRACEAVQYLMTTHRIGSVDS